MPHQCTGCGHTFEDGSKEMLSGCPDCGGNTFQFRPEGASMPDGPSDGEGSTADANGSQPAGNPPADAEPPRPEAELQDGVSSVAETVGRATTKVRDFVSSGPQTDPGPDPNASWPSELDESGDLKPAHDGPEGKSSPEDPYPAASTELDADIIDADARRANRESTEDDAQASARTEVVSEDELDGTASAPSTDATEAAGDTDDAETARTARQDTSGGGLADVQAGTAEPPVDSDGEVVSEPSEAEPDITELREQLNDQFESIKIVEPGQYELNLMELYDREEYIIALQENGRYVIQVPEQWMGEEPGER